MYFWYEKLVSNISAYEASLKYDIIQSEWDCIDLKNLLYL